MIKIQIGKWFSLRIGKLPARKPPVVVYDRPYVVDDFLAPDAIQRHNTHR